MPSIMDRRPAQWRDGVGRALIALAAFGVFYSCARFMPAALGTPNLTDYSKNHIVRELLFGAGLALYVIYLCAAGRSVRDCWTILTLGALVVMVFWVGSWAGFGLEGLDQIWQGRVTAADAYGFHVPQTVIFLAGALLLCKPPQVNGRNGGR